ncbi:ketoacyl-synt-domain-containing protein [Lophiostoma macrostomum CBS 122681]|uniref:Ketoacyl-synt-domain-containing protein n=1 Tax=Lophiostoma macrostomum CBS 122681 TaxID=1314788 RepID=A0A6A6SIA9_9PLEO|nr:ketoacyl-synt-domain-containing protein [Lophiostoma macrostomum CBS 122681]
MAEPIAIIGSTCRFPGSVNTPSQLWNLLENPRDILGEVSEKRVDYSGIRRSYDHSYLLQDDIRRLDAAFFKINNKEPCAMDPQQRILLETVHQALESTRLQAAIPQRRRQRTQSASIINLSMVTDVGYVAKAQRANRSMEEHLRSKFYTPLSETEFHQSIMQAILAGRRDSGNAGITMGIRPFVDNPKATSRPSWYNNPRSYHMIVPMDDTSDGRKTPTPVHNLDKNFDYATTSSEAADAFQKLMCQKIEAMLKVPAARINIEAPLSSVGLDSPLAVEIRTWFLLVSMSRC